MPIQTLVQARRNGIIARKKRMKATGVQAEQGPLVEGAKDRLTSLSPQDMAPLVWDRLCGKRDPRLPELAREEYPADIFLYVVDQRLIPGFGEALGEACGSLLKRNSEEATLANVPALGELCYLSARIRAWQAIDGLTKLARREDATAPVLPNEDLRQRALSCLLTLLVADPTRMRPEHKTLFENRLKTPGCEMMALTALIGLWHENPEALTGQLSRGYRLDPSLLRDELAFAGLSPPRRRDMVARRSRSRR